MKRLLVSLLFVLSGIVNSQQVDGQTGNIVYTTLNPPPPGAPYTWNGFIPSQTNGGGLTGGNIPAYNTTTGTFIFGYMPGTVAYTTGINFALANAGTGIQLNGYKYSWQYFNQDYSRGTLSGNISVTNNSGKVVESYAYTMPKTTEGWTLMSGTQNFNTQYAPPSLGNLQVSFTGKDDRWWAGYYGPQIKNIDVKLLYSVTPPPPSGGGSSSSGTTSCTAYSVDPTCIAQNSLINTSTTTTSTTSTAYTAPVTTTTDTTVALAPVTTTTTSTSTAPSTNTTTSTNTSTQTSTTSATPTTSLSTTTTSTTVATSAVAGKETTNSNGTSIGLSVIAKNQQREQAIAMQASQNAIQSANEVANQVTQDAQNIASQAVSNSFSVAQTASKPVTTATEFKTTNNNTDLTFQNNTSSSSLSLFASPTTTTTQKQNDSTQSTTITQAVVTQTTKTIQATQQVQTVDTSSRTNVVQIGTNVSATEIENKPQVTTFVAKTTEVINPTNTSIQENNSQQQQQTYTLVPPQTELNVQQTIIQKAKVDTTQNSVATNIMPETQNTQQQTLINLLPPQTIVTTAPVSSQIAINNNDKQIQSVEAAKPQEIVQVTNSVSYSLLPPQQPIQQSTNPIINNFNLISNQTPMVINQPMFANVSENNTNDSQKMLLDRSSPVFQTLENKSIEAQNNATYTQGPVVNRNAQNNEVAGNVDITRMAVAPAGYADYLNLALRDAAFYAPKEVYKNQRNVDNVRLLRSLSSDRLHQEMVNQQYERK